VGRLKAPCLLDVVEAGGLADEPPTGFERTGSEYITIEDGVVELEHFVAGDELERVPTNDCAGSDAVHAIVGNGISGGVFDDVGEAFGGAGGAVLLGGVMPFEDVDVAAVVQQSGGLAGDVQEHSKGARRVGREHYRTVRRVPAERVNRVVGQRGCCDEQRGAVVNSGVERFFCALIARKIDDEIDALRGG